MLYGSGRVATNDKVAKLARLVNEAAHEVVVISDSDVRVRPDYLRQVTAPLRDPKVGAVTCFYVPDGTHHLHRPPAERRHDVRFLRRRSGGLATGRSEVRAGTDHRHHARAPRTDSAAIRSSKTAPPTILLVGRLIAEQGYEVVLLRYAIETVCDYGSLGDLLHKRLRWIVVMRHMRPWGHLGLLLTQGLPWSLAAVAVHPTAAVALGYLGGYFALRMAMTWIDRDPRPAPVGPVETNAADSGLGCGGVRHLADQFRPQQHPLARRRLLHSRWPPGSGSSARSGD